MARSWKFTLIALALGIIVGSVPAATVGEIRAYSKAAQAYQDRNWWQAESWFGQFVEKFPKSEQRAQALLYQAVSRFQLTNSAGTINLLSTNLERAGLLADEYQFWIAEAHFQKRDFAAAAEAYAELGRRYAASKLRIKAYVGEAASRMQLQDWAQVVALLGTPETEFARAIPGVATNDLVARGLLLLGQAQMARTNHVGAEAAVAPLSGRKFGGAVDWRAEHLRYEAQIANGRLPEALITSSNLMALATAVTEDRANLMAESVALHAGVLEQAGRRAEAKIVFERNLAPGTPDERQRQALLKITELALEQGQVAEATNMLIKYLNQFSNAPSADAALLALGEIYLKQAAATLAPNTATAAMQNTNGLDAALTCFDRLVNNFTNSAFIGKAELDRGWCLSLRNQLPQSAVAFERATERLGDIEDLVVARFKLGDALFAQREFARALERYQQAAAALPRWPRAREALGAELYYQILRASLEVTNGAGASAAMEQILKSYPRSAVADAGLLLLVQGLADGGSPERARMEFEKFIAQAPDSPLRAEVEVVIGRTREQQADWPGAIAGYDQWLVRFPTNALRPRVEFQRAWANSMAGRETNALTQFTNFLAQFPTDPLAPQAQWWVADYFYRQNDFPNAEINYKLVFQNWPTNELAYEARMMAGRAALGGSRYKDAIDHFISLTSDTNCPPALWSKAVFAYGDALMTWAPPGAETNKLANYETAIRVFVALLPTAATNPIAVLAWGEMAKCYHQLGSASNAVFCFSQVVTSAVANVAARSEAQVGIAAVFEKLAQPGTGDEEQRLLRQALGHLEEVVYKSNLGEAELPDLFWVKKAGLEAWPLLERLRDWDHAEKLYLRLQELVPVSRAAFQRKIDQARERRAAEKPPPQV